MWAEFYGDLKLEKNEICGSLFDISSPLPLYPYETRGEYMARDGEGKEGRGQGRVRSSAEMLRRPGSHRWSTGGRESEGVGGGSVGVWYEEVGRGREGGGKGPG